METVSIAPPRRRWLSQRRREAIHGYLFLLPWALGFALFIAGPTLASFALSFTTYDLARAPVFIGLGNYLRAVTADPLFWPSLLRTFYFAGVYVPLAIAASLALALFLARELPGVVVLRGLYFLPHLVPIVAATVIWAWILEPKYGLLNYLLGRVGLTGPGWLATTEWAVPGLIVLSLWRAAGGNTMVIFLAGLKAVPAELYEAASLDGANGWQKFRHVTVPMISPTVFFNLVLGVIGALKVFATAFVATKGGPAYATYFFALHIYNNAFQFFQMGYAACLAWIFLVIVLVLTWIQFRTSARWVYYEGEVR